MRPDEVEVAAVTGYDVIGDVHGHADKLVALLYEMDYRCVDGVWRHPDRVAVFVGDLIDRGPAQLRTLETVRPMIDAGSALMVLGNHEFNAVAWLTHDPARGEWCRPHNDKNRHQHSAFLGEVGDGSPVHRRWIEWFMSIPLWHDLGGLRVVHACWDRASMDALAGLLTDKHCLTERAVIEGSASRWVATRNGLSAFDAIERVLKGPEVGLGEGRSYLDKEGNRRHKARYKWWDPAATTLRTGALIPSQGMWADGGSTVDLPEIPVTGVPAPYGDDVPVIFGHYWCNDDFEIIGPTTMCVDFSAGRGGRLAAYRWSGELRLDRRHLVSV